ncbi:MAG: AAA family ATPase [Cyanobacteria bacterium J06643_13]
MSEKTETLRRVLAEREAEREAEKKSAQEAKDKAKAEAILAALRYTPREIVSYLDRFVRQQDAAKRTLALAVYQHYLGLSQRENQDSETSFKLPFGSQHILLIGNSGCGKSYLVKLLAQLIDVPYYTISAANLVPSGCLHGFSVNDVLEALYLSSNRNLDLTQRAIIFIDEIDKIHLKGELKHDAFIQGVQDSLLTALDGSSFSISSAGQRYLPTSSRIDVDTTGILFICAGAFAGLDKIIERRLQKNQKTTVGFDLINHNNSEEMRSQQDSQILQKVETADLVEFGLIPEFVGRFTSVSVLDSLNSKDLIEILLNSQDSVWQQKQNLFNFYDIELTITPAALEAIAEKALALNTGVRSLTRIVNDCLREIEFQLPELAQAGISQITVTEQTLENSSDFVQTSSLAKTQSL